MEDFEESILGFFGIRLVFINYIFTKQQENFNIPGDPQKSTPVLDVNILDLYYHSKNVQYWK